MNKIILLLIITLFSFPAFASTLVFEDAGFQIDSLDAPPGPAGSQPLMMLLPAEDGFAPNINVQVQPYADSISEYKKLSESQFVQLNLKVIRAELAGDTAIFEYSGTMGQNLLHWYAKAMKKGSFIYLVTATSPQSNWPKHKAKLVSVVDSFKLK